MPLSRVGGGGGGGGELGGRTGSPRLSSSCCIEFLGDDFIRFLPGLLISPFIFVQM